MPTTKGGSSLVRCAPRPICGASELSTNAAPCLLVVLACFSFNARTLAAGDRADSVGDVVHQATARQLKGDFESSTALREQLLADVAPNPDSQIRLWALLENGRDYTKLGKRTKAIESYDQLLSEYPDYGLEDGKRINILYERVKARGYERHSRERMVALAEIWEDPRFADKPQIWNIGRQIVAICHFSGDDDSLLKYGAEMVDRSRAAYAGYDDDTRKRHRITNAYGESLVYLVDHHMAWGNVHHALLLCQEMLREMPGSHFAEYARQVIPELRSTVDRMDHQMLDRAMDDDYVDHSEMDILAGQATTEPEARASDSPPAVEAGSGTGRSDERTTDTAMLKRLAYPVAVAIILAGACWYCIIVARRKRTSS